MSVEETVQWYSGVANANASRHYYSTDMKALQALDAETLARLVEVHGDQIFRANANLLPRALRSLHTRRDHHGTV